MNCKFAKAAFYILCLLPLSVRGETPFYDLGSTTNTMRPASNGKPVDLPSAWTAGGQPLGGGSAMRSGSGVPSAGLGNNGDYYIDKAATPPNLYGPKTAGAWGSATALGSAGPTGAGVAAGGTTGQFLKKLSNADFDTSWATVTGSGTVTSINVAAGTTGSDVNVSGGPVTTSGTITVNIPTASAINRGALASADWTTFNNKLGSSSNGSSLTGLSFSQLAGRLTNTQVDQGAIAPSFSTLTDAATITWTVDPNLTVQNTKVTLGGNRTLGTPTGLANGMTGVLIVIQDGTGGRTLALPSGSKVINGGAGVATLTSAANSIDILSWVYDGVNWYWTYGKNFN